MYETLKSLPHDTLILTVNRRLALRLQQNLASKKAKVQAARPIYALNDWFVNLWQGLQKRGQTLGVQSLSPLQEQAIWLNLLEQSPQGEALLQPFQAAKQLMSTWKLLWQWNLKLDEVDWGQQEEGLLFYHWAQMFEQTLEEKGWLTEAQIPTLLLDRVTELDFKPLGKSLTSSEIMLVGFDDIPPQVQTWLDAFQREGWPLSFYQSALKTQCRRLEFSDPTQELQQAIVTAKQWAENHEGVFALIVPDLSQSKREVEQILNQILDTKACLSPERSVSDNFNISAGHPLLELPMIQALIKSFDWLQASITLDTLFHSLQSPFFHHHFSDQDKRARWIYDLKAMQKPSFSLDSLIDYAQGCEWDSCIQMLKAMKAFKPSWLQTESIADKCPKLLRWLEIIAWPGERPLNSIEHQGMQSFYLHLQTWQALEKVSNPMSGPEALQWLKRLLKDCTFQPESRPARIQVMGLLEAAGQEFDYAWVVGMNHETWPAPPKPNPFIPLTVQKDLKMPHAHAQRELMFAQQVTQTLKKCAPEVMFSHGITSDGKHFFASPLIVDLPLQPNVNHAVPSLEQTLQQAVKLKVRPPLSPVPLVEGEAIRGGVALIQNQAACPFKAFAKHRLDANEPESYEEGIVALDRGIIVHRAMELMWQQLKDHTTLCSKSEDELKAMIHHAMANIEQDPSQSIEQNLYWTIEKRRLETIILSWLSLEKQRQPFKVVRSEAQTQIKLAGLTLTGRIDRVDLTEDGHPIIIDYKTGKVDINACFGDRPEAPQLPLYCFADFPPNPKGVVFAMLRRDACEFVGITEQDIIPKVATLNKLKQEQSFETWQDLLSYWRERLNALAQQFLEGHCEVAPKTAQTCLHCDLNALCRVGEV